MPSNDLILANALNLEPKEAIKYLESLGFEISFDWEESAKAAKKGAFSIAKVMRADILQDVKDQLENVLKNGETYEVFRENFEKIIGNKGWFSDELTSPWRIKTIFKTNLQSAYMAGKLKTFEENKSARPYLMYEAVLDGSTRPAHAELNGIIKPIDDSFWDTHTPPNGYNCRCSIRALTEDQAMERGVTKSNPRIKPDPGFDSKPGEFNPEKDKYSKDILKKAKI